MFYTGICGYEQEKSYHFKSAELDNAHWNHFCPSHFNFVELFFTQDIVGVTLFEVWVECRNISHKASNAVWTLYIFYLVDASASGLLSLQEKKMWETEHLQKSMQGIAMRIFSLVCVDSVSWQAHILKI